MLLHEGTARRRTIENDLVIAGCIAAALLIAIIACIAFLCRDPNPRRPAHIDGANGFVQAHGTNLYDGDGNLLQLKGVNLGNWFIQEPWMSLASVGNFDTGHYTQRRGRTAMRQNPNLDEDQIARLEQIYLDHYIREEDVRTIAALGMNAVRIPFSYMNLTEGGALRRMPLPHSTAQFHGAKSTVCTPCSTCTGARFAKYGPSLGRRRAL